MRAIYTTGSAIKAKDLNDDFEQLLHGVEEARHAGVMRTLKELITVITFS